MDIVLEQIMLYVDQIAGFVSDSAPMVWELLLAQVKVHQVGYMIGAIIGGVGTLIFLVYFVYGIKGCGDNTDPWWAAMGGLVTAVLFGVFLYEYIARFINPSWYAIKLLLQTAGIGG